MKLHLIDATSAAAALLCAAPIAIAIVSVSVEVEAQDAQVRLYDDDDFIHHDMSMSMPMLTLLIMSLKEIKHTCMNSSSSNSYLTPLLHAIFVIYPCIIVKYHVILLSYCRM